MRKLLELDSLCDQDMMSLERNSDAIDHHFNNSEGQPVMSDEDMKVCLLRLKFALDSQLRINQTLINKINEIEHRKFKVRFWKK